MIKILIILILALPILFAQENIFWQDLNQVFQKNIQTNDTDFKPSISRIRKLFYDGTLWNLFISAAQSYAKPTDEISLAFQKKYVSGVNIVGQVEDFAHTLGALDAYLHPQNNREMLLEDSEPITLANYDWCSWLGDLASALAMGYKQNTSMEIAFQRYASDADLRGNIAAFHLYKLSLPYSQQSYQFPIIEICQQHYNEWHNFAARQHILLEYFQSLGLVWDVENAQFTQISQQNFIKNNLTTLKSAAWAYYYANSRVTFKDQDAETILKLFLNRLSVFYLNP